jgi:uncharacterized protein YndB with AHSA1/START domain
MPLRHHVRKGFKNMTKTLEKPRVIHATPERTFQALTEKEELERWFVRDAPRARSLRAFERRWGHNEDHSKALSVIFRSIHPQSPKLH